jgi:hypothetical protein
MESMGFRSRRHNGIVFIILLTEASVNTCYSLDSRTVPGFTPILPSVASKWSLGRARRSGGAFTEVAECHDSESWLPTNSSIGIPEARDRRRACLRRLTCPL